jgi:hypothetical protein
MDEEDLMDEHIDAIKAKEEFVTFGDTALELSKKRNAETEMRSKS